MRSKKLHTTHNNREQQEDALLTSAWCQILNSNRDLIFFSQSYPFRLFFFVCFQSYYNCIDRKQLFVKGVDRRDEDDEIDRLEILVCSR